MLKKYPPPKKIILEITQTGTRSEKEKRPWETRPVSWQHVLGGHRRVIKGSMVTADVFVGLLNGPGL